MLTVGSLFSGIGGLDLGFERAGFEIRWQVEIDPYCRRVLAKHWPTVARYEDVREVGAHNLERVDVIVGGFPCQPHSLAGERNAKADARDLWPDFLRVICHIGPRWAVAENVPGLLSSEDGRFFGGVLRDLAVEGYDAEWEVIPACAVGAPHTRNRVFIIAYPNGDGIQGCPTFALSRLERVPWFSDIRSPTDFLQRPGIPQPLFRRIGDGLPGGVDRLRGLGNSVVPQVAQYVAECVLRHAETEAIA